MVVPVPQMTKDSGNDICLQKDGALCVVLIAKNKDSVSPKALDEMYNVGQTFSSKISRGISFYFSWLDAEVEPEFAAILSAPDQSDVFPRLIVLNPGKTKRFLVNEGDITESAIAKTLDKILGGDAKFKRVKGN